MSELNEIEKKLKGDFRLFMVAVFKHLNLPKPTQLQILQAQILQNNTDPYLVILGYRGMGKTLISAIYLLWRLYKDPTKLMRLWSSTEDHASDTTKFMLTCIKEIPFLNHLMPDGDMYQSALAFDVKGKNIGREPSVKSAGIKGQVTGTRGDVLLIDDPETHTNGATVKDRAKIDRAIEEASHVVKQDQGGQIIILGTVHFDDSLYTRLLQRGFRIVSLPASVPPKDVQDLNWIHYPVTLRKLFEQRDKYPVGTPLCRFPREVLEQKLSVWGPLSYERQYLVNMYQTRWSAKAFNFRKIILFEADKDGLPIKLHHDGFDEKFLDQESMGFSSASIGDKLYRPYRAEDSCKPYERKLLYIDPSGTGVDEFAFTAGGVCNGYFVNFKTVGYPGGATEENIHRAIETAFEFGVDAICVEANFGQSLVTQMVRNQMREQFKNRKPINVYDKAVRKNKLERIKDTLSPVINTGRFVMTPSGIRADYETSNLHVDEDRISKRLTYQLSYFSDKTENKLQYDDRIDSCAGCVGELLSYLGVAQEEGQQSWEDYLYKKICEAPAVEAPTIGGLTVEEVSAKMMTSSSGGLQRSGGLGGLKRNNLGGFKRR